MKNYKNLWIGLASLFFVFGVVLSTKAALIAYYYTPSSQNGAVASTTSTFLLSTGTMTKTFVSDGYEQVSWLVALASSTTPPVLTWTNFYSNNNTDWYAEDYSYASTTNVHIAAEKTDTWVYATSSATTLISTGPDGVTKYIGRRIVVPNLGTTYTKTVFTVTGASARLDVQSALKNQVVKDK